MGFSRVPREDTPCVLDQAPPGAKRDEFSQWAWAELGIKRPFLRLLGEVHDLCDAAAGPLQDLELNLLVKSPNGLEDLFLFFFILEMGGNAREGLNPCRPFGSGDLFRDGGGKVERKFSRCPGGTKNSRPATKSCGVDGILPSINVSWMRTSKPWTQREFRAKIFLFLEVKLPYLFNLRDSDKFFNVPQLVVSS